MTPRPVHPATKPKGRCHLAPAQSGYQSDGLPRSIRRVPDQTLVSRAAVSLRHYRGASAGLVKQYQSRGVNQALLWHPTSVGLYGVSASFAPIWAQRRNRTDSTEECKRVAAARSGCASAWSGYPTSRSDSIQRDCRSGGQGTSRAQPHCGVVPLPPTRLPFRKRLCTRRSKSVPRQPAARGHAELTRLRSIHHRSRMSAEYGVGTVRPNKMNQCRSTRTQIILWESYEA
jgi:hypothetical protein